MPKPPPADAEPLSAEFWQNFRYSGGGVCLLFSDIFVNIFCLLTQFYFTPSGRVYVFDRMNWNHEKIDTGL